MIWMFSQYPQSDPQDILSPQTDEYCTRIGMNATTQFHNLHDTYVFGREGNNFHQFFIHAANPDSIPEDLLPPTTKFPGAQGLQQSVDGRIHPTMFFIILAYYLLDYIGMIQQYSRFSSFVFDVLTRVLITL